MNVYNIVIIANYQCNIGQIDYSQVCQAFYNEKCVAEHYDSKHKGNMHFTFPVMERLVRSNTGTGAILKFKKWQAKGFNEDFLLSEKD